MDGGGADGVMGSSAGAAGRARRTAALGIANALAALEGDARETALLDAAYEVGRLIGDGFSVSDGSSLLFSGAMRCGLVDAIGVDEVQSTINCGIGEGRRAAAEDDLEQGRRGGGGEQQTATGEPAPPPPIDVHDGDDDAPIPPREWLLGMSLCRKFVSLLIAPGGTGKTALMLAQLIALASGVAITNEHIFQRCRVLILCFEDSLDEIRRRIRACRLHYKLDNLKGWLFFAVITRAHGKLLMQGAAGAQDGGLAAAIDDIVVQHGIDVLGLDPLKKAHGVEENDNTGMDEVMQILTDMAVARNIAVAAAHHTSKGAMEAGNADKARGASSVRDAARIVKTVTPQSEDEAQLFGVDERDRRLMLRLDNAKINLAPPGTTEWFRLISVPLGNGTEGYPNGDHVQTIEPWQPPDTWAGMHNELSNRILDAIEAGVDGERYSNHASAREPRQAWKVVMAHIDKTEPQARAIVGKWIKNGVLEVREYESRQAKGKAKGLHLNHTKRPG